MPCSAARSPLAVRLLTAQRATLCLRAHVLARVGWSMSAQALAGTEKAQLLLQEETEQRLVFGGSFSSLLICFRNLGRG